MKELLQYWNINLHGEIQDNILKFDNHVGTGLVDYYQFNENFKMVRVDAILYQKLEGSPYVYDDEEEFITIIFGDASSILFGGKINIPLNGALFSNKKRNVTWGLAIDQPLQLVILRVKFDYFYKMIGKSQKLAKYIQPDKEYIVFEEMSLAIKGGFYKLLDIKTSDYLDELLFSCTYYLFHLLIDQLSKKDTSSEHHETRIHFHGLIQVRAMILENIGPPIEVDRLAKLAGLSSSGLRIQFKKTFGQPIYQFQQQVRLDQAKDLLIEGKKTVSMISVDLGFSNMSHFASVFKKAFGITPKQYQKKQKEELKNP
ncbi:AraC family transcriptional regulator [Flammeovirga sp. SubArs3]|uniref:helix-turn-helix domain-containing protein n=1 Tax=Flammeovirga sp. SubArs3 TaxID=2995316 RepID=UPI00248C69F2|nr:AraC family transcriptional regulator [Flammeovirga sp. SubArs3]